MKRYLVPRPISSTRCFYNTPTHSGKEDKLPRNAPAAQHSASPQRTREDVAYLDIIGSSLDEPSHTPNADDVEEKDPFAVFDEPFLPPSSPAPANGDKTITVETLKEQLQRFDRGEHVEFQGARSVKGLGLEGKSREMKMAQKPYRYLTTRDKEVARQEEEKYQAMLAQKVKDEEGINPKEVVTRVEMELGKRGKDEDSEARGSKPGYMTAEGEVGGRKLRIRKVNGELSIPAPKTAFQREEWDTVKNQRTEKVRVFRRKWDVPDNKISDAEYAARKVLIDGPISVDGIRAPLATSCVRVKLEQKRFEREPPMPTSTTNSTSSLSPRQLATLPQSPLIVKAPNFWNVEAYSAKSPPSADLTPFQKKLAHNPYAHALASPLRTCTITKVMLPRDLQLGLEDLENPVDGKRWYMPRSLTLPVRRSQLKAIDPPLDADGEPMHDEVEMKIEDSTNRITRIGQRHYVLLRKDLIMGLGTKGSRYFGGWNSFHLVGTSRGMRGIQQAGMLNWRGDMDTFVLKLLRRKVVEIIAKIVYARKGYVHYTPSWDEVVREKQMGCVLWLGPEPISAAPRQQPGGEEVGHVEEKRGMAQKTLHEKWREEDALPEIPGPGHYATITNPPHWHQKLPVHNALRLLGPEIIAEIRARGPKCEKRELLVIKSKQETLKLRMLLWNLEHYLVDPEAEESEWMPADDLKEGTRFDAFAGQVRICD